MYPYPSPMLARGGFVKFIGQAAGPNSATPVAFPAGTAAGDLALVLIARGVGATLSGWGKETQGSELSVLWTALTQALIDTPPSLSGTPSFGTLVYRGPKTVAKVSGTSTTADPPTIPGFSKNGGLAIVTAAVFTGGYVQNPPTGFTSRHHFLNDNGFRYLSSADLMSPNLYTNGASLPWGYGGSGSADMFALELY